jgi:hypothetical protein
MPCRGTSSEHTAGSPLSHRVPAPLSAEFAVSLHPRRRVAPRDHTRHFIGRRKLLPVPPGVNEPWDPANLRALDAWLDQVVLFVARRIVLDRLGRWPGVEWQHGFAAYDQQVHETLGDDLTGHFYEHRPAGAAAIRRMPVRLDRRVSAIAIVRCSSSSRRLCQANGSMRTIARCGKGRRLINPPNQDSTEDTGYGRKHREKPSDQVQA